MSWRIFSRKVAALVVLTGGLLTSSGCIYLVVGGVGAIGGYVVSPDTVEGVITDQDQVDVWDAAVEVVSIMGLIEEQNETGGVLIGRVSGVKVTVTLVPMSADSVKISVKARKAFMPKVRIAQDVYAKIVTQLGG